MPDCANVCTVRVVVHLVEDFYWLDIFIWAHYAAPLLFLTNRTLSFALKRIFQCRCRPTERLCTYYVRFLNRFALKSDCLTALQTANINKFICFDHKSCMHIKNLSEFVTNYNRVAYVDRFLR